MTIQRRRGGQAAITVALAAWLAACGGAANESPGGGGGDAADGEAGAVYVSGSSTVEPISLAVAEAFKGENPAFEYTVEGPGTGDGFALFCAGETDVQDASRAIDEEEVAACEENAVEYVELEVAIDGIALLTHPANEALDCLTSEDIYALLGPESESFENWSDANALADELGAPNAPYPELPLVISAPGEESGTFDSFLELSGLEEIAEERGQDEAVRIFEGNANDEAIIEGIIGSESSLGWVGYAFYANHREEVKALEVDTGDGCVAPTDETISDGSYPLARPLYIYVNTAKAEENPDVAAYVDFYLSDAGLANVAEVGYVDLPEDRIDAARDAWESR